MKINPSPIQMEQDAMSANAASSNSKWPGILLAILGILLILGTYIAIWLFRDALANVSPRGLTTLWYGAGGMALLFLTAGLPLGAILVAAGGARQFPASERARRVLLPLLGIQLVYFAFHALRLVIDLSLPFLLFAFTGFLFVVLFLALVWVWARKRPGLEPERQRVADLQLGAGLCFFSAAWQSCGLVGAPGFAMYPEIVQKLGNQSFIGGQALAVQFFLVLGFVFLLLAMRAERPQSRVGDKPAKPRDQAT
jgi:hypothetical protein